MKFDAYGASIRGSDRSTVAHLLAHAIDGIALKGRPMKRFGEVIAIDSGNRTAAWVGQDETGLVYVEGKGETTPQLVAAIRTAFPDHAAPRIDVAEDYDGEGTFDALQGLIRSAKGPKVKAGYVALPDDSEDGRTWSVGKRGGVAYVRLYEAGKHPDRLHLARPHWVRAEVEVRPHYARDKLAAAKMQPLEVWGLASWSHRVGEALTQCPITRFEPEVRVQSFDKTTRYLAVTFRRHWQEMLANGEDIPRTLRAAWEEEEQDQRKWRKIH